MFMSLGSAAHNHISACYEIGSNDDCLLVNAMVPTLGNADLMSDEQTSVKF